MTSDEYLALPQTEMTDYVAYKGGASNGLLFLKSMDLKSIADLIDLQIVNTITQTLDIHMSDGSTPAFHMPQKTRPYLKMMWIKYQEMQN